ncbi:ABC transporter permease [Actinospongicola halichondriae]|uniref:ABC transporter permease n=1 Tax=Actinospongicola halichondriae TaxID=3236844 RepID=UPI003D3EB201
MTASVDRRRVVTAAVFAAPVAFLAVFFAVPAVTLISTGLRDGGSWDLGAVVDVLTSSSTRRVAWFTLWQATVSTAATVVLALPAAWVIGRVRIPGRSLFSALLVVPFVLPTVVVGTAFLAVFDRGGPLGGLRQTAAAVIVAHVFFNYAVIARTVGAAWLAIDPATEEAARTLGASRWVAFRTVTLPQLRPALAGAASIVFLFTFTSFGVVKILGGPRIATIEVEIHRVTTELLDLRVAAVLSLLQLGAVIAALVLYRRAGVRRGSGRLRSGASTLRRPSGVQWLLVAWTAVSSGALLGIPIVSLVWRSFDNASGPGLAYYRALDTVGRGSVAFVPPIEAIRNSLLFAFAAATTALVVGGLAAIGLHRLGGRARGFADGSLMLPLGTSAVTIGLGFLIALDEPPLDLRTSPILIPAAQAIIAVPFVVRTVLPALDAVPARLRDAAASLGASPWRVWTAIDLRLLRRPALVAYGFAFAISLGEFGATVFIARADAPTVPVAIFRALGQPGALNVGQAMALSTILLAMTTLVMLIVDRVGDARVGGF